MNEYEPFASEEMRDRLLWKSALLRRVGDARSNGARNVTFSVYRRGDISATHTAGQVNAPDEVQFDGIIFDDGTTVIHWNTEVRSTAVFESFDDLLDIHGHPEENYATEFVFEGDATVSRHELLTWDWKEQPDIDAVHAAMKSVFNGHNIPDAHEVPDSGGDHYALLVSSEELSLDEVQSIYDEWTWE